MASRLLQIGSLWRSERPIHRSSTTWAPADARAGGRGAMLGLHMVTDDHCGYRLSTPGPDLVASPPTFQFPYVSSVLRLRAMTCAPCCTGAPRWQYSRRQLVEHSSGIVRWPSRCGGGRGRWHRSCYNSIQLLVALISARRGRGVRAPAVDSKVATTLYVDN